jgi:hypothetical protein
MTHGGRHTGRIGADAVLIAALAGGATTSEAAENARVSLRTVRRRVSDPTFLGRLQEARSELLAAALARVSASAGGAVATLVQLMGAAHPPTVRLGASKAILEYGIRLRAETELVNRLEAIEEHLALTEERE